MNKLQLIESAAKIPLATVTASIEFEAKREVIAAELIRRMLLRADIDRLVGMDNRDMMQNNARNMLRFMVSMSRHFEPEALIETALWVRRAYRAHGFQLGYWPANMDTAVEILRENLTPESFASIYPCFEWLMLHNPAFAQLSDIALGQGPTDSISMETNHA